MTSTDIETPGNGSTTDFKPPYGSFQTLNNLFDRMTEDGIPARIDRSYLSNLPNSVIATTTHALKSLDLTDAAMHPTPTLVELVENPEQRKSVLAGVLREKYAPQLALGQRATTAQLVESFKETGATGSTIRKSIAFFLAAARYAEITVSPYFKTPKPSPSERPKKAVRRAEVNGGGHTDDPPKPPAVPNPLKDLDPFIVGLVQALPPAGSPFPDEKRKAWFQAAQGIFDLIYKDGGGGLG